MSRSLRTDLCPSWFAWVINNAVRRWLHKPKEILGQLIAPGSTIVELGCGSGPFTIALAEMVGPSGRVIAADLQPAMLRKVRRRITQAGVQDRVELHQCGPDLRRSEFAGLQRISARPGVSTKSAQPQKPSAPTSQPARFISEPANTLRRGSAVRPVFLAENETSPLDALILSETRVKLMTLLRTLHHRHRQVLLLRYFSGLKIREIAARLNLPYSNVQARLYSAFGRLRRSLYCDSRWSWLQKEFRDQFPPLEGSWDRNT